MNIINAIINLINNPITKLKQYKVGNNRANNAGDALEDYIKDLFAGVHQDFPIQARTKLIGETFSYCGNQNNPPDAILKNGDAIEIKKIESANSALALNSSYPKQKLYSDNPMLSKACKECECWSEKDIIYAVGVIDKSTQDLSSLAFVYGTEYCAAKDVYERIKNTIKTGVESIPNIEFTESRELGHVNKVDPLGITYLRVRGMWGIENPFVAFKNFYTRRKNCFNFMCIINTEKFNSYSNSHVIEKMALQNDNNLFVQDIDIPNPDNPAQFIPCKLISFYQEKTK